jgi:hypothetical protein
MASDIHTYSVQETDKKNQDLVRRIKQHTEKTGMTMSFLILKSLEMYDQKYISSGGGE